jgi:hypothetical protein
MADHMAAEIHIGGKIRRSVAQALCKVIARAGVSLEWGGGQYRPDAPDDLLPARSAAPGEPLLLKLYDDQARYAEFDSLETFLRKHGIPYSRWGEGKYEYDPEVVVFRPGRKLLSWPTNHDQQPVVSAFQLTPIEAKLTNLVEALKRGKAEAVEVIAQIEDIRQQLRAELPPAVPAMESLEIVED